MDITTCRQEIDKIDAQVLSLMNQRAALALSIAGIKQQKSLPVFDPEREHQLKENIQAQNQGPLSNGAVSRIFSAIIQETRNLEDHLTNHDL